MKTLRLLTIALCLAASGAEADEMKAGRIFCTAGQPGRDLTVAECKREIARTIRTFKNAGAGTNLGVRVTACSNYCEALYPKLPGY